MFIFSNLLNALATIIDIVLNTYKWLIIARAVISWVSPDPYNPIVNFIYQATEPVLYRVRRYLPFSIMGTLDITPIIVLLIIIFLNILLVDNLRDFALTLR